MSERNDWRQVYTNIIQTLRLQRAEADGRRWRLKFEVNQVQAEERLEAFSERSSESDIAVGAAWKWAAAAQ